MKRARKDQLNKKLHQIYKHGSGRIDGIIENLLQEHVLGHTYIIGNIGCTAENPPCEEDDSENKDFTLVEFVLDQKGNGYIASSSIPVSNNMLQQIASRIDMAYYHWMQREQVLLENHPNGKFSYYQDVHDIVTDDVPIYTKDQWARLTELRKDEIIALLEKKAFFPDGDETE